MANDMTPEQEDKRSAADRVLGAIGADDAEDGDGAQAAEQEQTAQSVLGAIGANDVEDGARPEIDVEAFRREAQALNQVGPVIPEPPEEPEEEVIPEDEFALNPVPDDGIRRRWYVLHAQSGQESSVRKNLELAAEQEGLSDRIINVLVPMEQVAEIKSGEKKVTKRKFFPGYVLIQLTEHPERDPELWHVIVEVPGVTGFIGSRNAPVPLEDKEVQDIVEEIRGERERPKPKVNFDLDERVKIIEGPFANFLGNIEEINAERGRLKIAVEIFERLTSVEVEVWQVEKV